MHIYGPSDLIKMVTSLIYTEYVIIDYDHYRMAEGNVVQVFSLSILKLIESNHCMHSFLNATLDLFLFNSSNYLYAFYVLQKQILSLQS